MAWSSPRTFAVGEIVTAAMMNEITANFVYLKGSSGAVAIDAGITASGVITATAGMVSAGTISGATHVTVSGIVTAQAGIVTATHISTAGNINMAASKTVDGIDVSVHAIDKQSSHGVAAIGSAQIAVTCCGEYEGDGTPNKAIPHSLGRMPYVVFLQASQASGYYGATIYGVAPTQMFYQSAGAFGSGGTVTAMDATNFYVGQSGRYAECMNVSGRGYYWTAIG